MNCSEKKSKEDITRLRSVHHKHLKFMRMRNRFERKVTRDQAILKQLIVLEAPISIFIFIFKAILRHVSKQNTI